MSCSFRTCSAWNGATARHLHHSGLVAEPGLGAELVLLWNTDMKGHAESRASPTFSSQPRPQDRTGGSALPQHHQCFPAACGGGIPERPDPWGCKDIWKPCTTDQLCGPRVEHRGSHSQSHVHGENCRKDSAWHMVPDPKIKLIHPNIKYVQRKYIQARSGVVVVG